MLQKNRTKAQGDEEFEWNYFEPAQSLINFAFTKVSEHNAFTKALRNALVNWASNFTEVVT